MRLLSWVPFWRASQRKASFLRFLEASNTILCFAAFDAFRKPRTGIAPHVTVSEVILVLADLVVMAMTEVPAIIRMTAVSVNSSSIKATKT